MDDATRNLFAKHQLRCTEQRRVVLAALRDTTSHPTADELYHLARPQVKRLSLATVYNALEAFCQTGLARRLPMSNGCYRYDGDTTEHLHVRFRDTCEIRDVPADLGRRLLESLPEAVLTEIEQALDIEINGVNIQIVATAGTGCGDCGCGGAE